MPRTKSPLSRREVLKFGAFTTVGGMLTPGISLAQAVVTDTKGISARDIQLSVKGTSIPGYEARPEAPGRHPIVLAISGVGSLMHRSNCNTSSCSRGKWRSTACNCRK